jgi:bacterioferritin-associated ferredoxin
MYVCVCKAVTEREIAEAIEEGACTTADITAACRGAGGDCGSCRTYIEDMIEARRRLPLIDSAAE